jgi:transketolase
MEILHNSAEVACSQLLVELMDDERLVVLTADTAYCNHLHLVRERYPERFFNLGLSEEDMIGTAAGLASMGFIPIVSTFSSFLIRKGLDPLLNAIAQPRLNVKFLGIRAGLTSYGGCTHQSVTDLAIMRALPNVAVLVPASPVEAARLLQEVIYDHQGPAYLRLGNEFKNYRLPCPYEPTVGGSHVFVEGQDCTILASGLMVGRAILASRYLDELGIHCRVVNAYSVKPLDEETVVRAARETGRIVTAEEHSIIGGLGSAVAELLAERAPVPMGRVGVKDQFGRSGRPAELFEYFQLTPKDVVQTVHDVLDPIGDSSSVSPI